LLLAFAKILGGAEPETAEESWQVHGRVVDEQGQPVKDFVAATYWSSNGKQWDKHGERIKVIGHKDLDKFWKDEGVLAALPDHRVKQVEGGEFVATMEDRPRVSIFVTDLKQERGGYVSVEKTAADKPVTVTLLPLVRVTGKIYCLQAGRTSDWTVAIVRC